MNWKFWQFWRRRETPRIWEATLPGLDGHTGRVLLRTDLPAPPPVGAPVYHRAIDDLWGDRAAEGFYLVEGASWTGR